MRCGLHEAVIHMPGRLMKPLFLAALLPVLAPAQPPAPPAPPETVYGPELEGFEYPFPVQRCPFTSQRVQLRMAYLDVAPAVPNGRTVVLLHGKNFTAATWEPTIKVLNRAGYRVVAPDQVGLRQVLQARPLPGTASSNWPATPMTC